MRLLKMHGAGNDYIYADCMNETIEDPAGLSIKISDRHFGVGGDGLIMICPSDVADCKMKMYNNDGSEGKMCGNGIRCVGKYVYDNGYVSSKHISVETLSGIKEIDLIVEDGICTGARVDMGEADIVPDAEITVRDRTFRASLVSVGNPHCIIFVDGEDELEPSVYGPEIERDPLFPNRTNVEFALMRNASEIRMRVWERGTGITMACGTGATATGAAAMALGLCGNSVKLVLDGGTLLIEKGADGHMYMTGPAEYVFDIKNYKI